jgi:hypothetical protein
MKRVITIEYLKSGKLKGSRQDGSREWITLMAGICMDGTALPPGLIYQALSGDIQDTWLDDFDTSKQCAYFTSSPTGWTNDNLGFSWLKDIFDPATKAKARHGRDYRLLILDGHNSHVTLKFLDYAEKHRIHIATFPPHSTH